MPWESPSLAGRSAKADRVLEGPGVCLRGGYGCGLASNQGRERLALMATMSAHLPAQNACLLVHAVVLKLRLQSTDAGRRLSSAVQRQPEGPRVWSRPRVTTCRMVQVYYRSSVISACKMGLGSAIRHSLSPCSQRGCSSSHSRLC